MQPIPAGAIKLQEVCRHWHDQKTRLKVFSLIWSETVSYCAVSVYQFQYQSITHTHKHTHKHTQTRTHTHTHTHTHIICVCGYVCILYIYIMCVCACTCMYRYSYAQICAGQVWKLFVCWLLNVPATCECISGTDLLTQFYVLPHWDRSCRPNFPS